MRAACLRFQDRLDELEQASLNNAILWTMYIGFFVLCGALLLLFILA